MEETDLTQELALARKAARAAGEILRGYWRRGGYKIGSKGHDNPVTAADLEGDQANKKLLPDPFDGTKEFINGIPEFAVAIALIEDGVPVLGVTYNPIKRELYWSARGV